MGVCSVAHPMKRPFHPLSRLNWDSEVLIFVEEVLPPYDARDPGIKPGPHCWGISILTTVPSLLSSKIDILLDLVFLYYCTVALFS